MDFTSLDSSDDIVAVSTPLGPAARGVVRLSGPTCLARSADVLTGAAGLAGGGFRAMTACLNLGPAGTLPVVVYLFRAPRSYTGQDMIELHLPGSAPLLERVVQTFLAQGVRAAEPGEFTLRAVLNGRIDLTGAEAVAELIAARSDGQLRAALELADGALARRVARLNGRLADLLAELEAQLDFADEPIRFIEPQAVCDTLAQVAAELDAMQAEAGDLNALAQRPTAAIVGPPNVGKSTLLNRLTGLERSLCSPVAGTTRDVLSAPLTTPGGREVRLLDCAGLDSAATPDALEQLARRAAWRAARLADLLIVVFDASKSDSPADWLARMPELAGRPAITVGNKIDQRTEPRPADGAFDGLWVSALTGQGIEALRASVESAVFADPTDRPAEGLMLNARHREALSEAEAAIERARAVQAESRQAGSQDAGELIAQEIREAVEQLGRISGRVVTDEILSRIFSRFCLGK